MKLNLKTLAHLIVLLNSVLLFKEIKIEIFFMTLIAIVFNFVISNKSARVFFKITLMMISIVFLKINFQSLLNTEAGISFILILSSLKLWELENTNDHFNMFLILALLESCLFLLMPSALAFILGMIKIVLFFYILIKIRNYNLALLNGKRLLILATPSLILSLILFYTFPRFTSGFINSSNSSIYFSGVDSKINFKKLGPLSLSSKVVFHVKNLDAKFFSPPLLYWRENVLWDFKNEEWKIGHYNLKSKSISLISPITTYQIQIERNPNEFLPLLDTISSLDSNEKSFDFFSDGSFKFKTTSKTFGTYNIQTSLNSSWNMIDPLMIKKGLKLTGRRSLTIEKLLIENKVFNSEDQKLYRIIDFFKSRQYEYSLNPPLYSSLEFFILHGKKGYCSHFAAAFAYLARVIGLPSRIISGYQGGEFNPFDQSILVRQEDAHSWVEVYIQNRGWIKVDPTSFVAPERIHLGANKYHEKLYPYVNFFLYKFPKSFLRSQLIVTANLWLDSISSTIDYEIFTFDKDRQQAFFKNLFAKSFTQITPVIFCLVLLIALVWFFIKRRLYSYEEKRQKRWNKFLKKMKRKGLNKYDSETASHFKNRCILKFPEDENYITTEVMAYINSFYRS